MLGDVYESYLGIDVGKKSHRACAIDRAGSVLFNGPLSNDEHEIDAVLARTGNNCLVVVDQKRNIGLLAIRRARLRGLDVAYLPGIAMSRAASLFPGDAKTDYGDAEVIARCALGVPGALRTIACEDSKIEKLRRLSAHRADFVVDRTHQKNRLRGLLFESNPTFEAQMDLSKAWTLSLLATFGGPWNILEAGRRRFRSWIDKAPRVSASMCEKIWASLKAATRVTEGQIEAEEYLVKSIAERTVALDGEIAAISSMIEAELEGDVAYEALLSVPGIGPKTADQLVFSVSIGDFKDHNALASYVGLAPKNRQSGTSISSVSSSKQGNKPLKTCSYSHAAASSVKAIITANTTKPAEREG